MYPFQAGEESAVAVCSQAAANARTGGYTTPAPGSMAAAAEATAGAACCARSPKYQSHQLGCCGPCVSLRNRDGCNFIIVDPRYGKAKHLVFQSMWRHCFCLQKFH